MLNQFSKRYIFFQKGWVKENTELLLLLLLLLLMRLLSSVCWVNLVQVERGHKKEENAISYKINKKETDEKQKKKLFIVLFNIKKLLVVFKTGAISLNGGEKVTLCAFFALIK